MPIQPNAQPYSHDGGTLGILVLHGFTGSPASVNPWGRDLAERGYSVRVPRLPGHGTRWQDLNRTTWHDWYGEADRALSELQRGCDRVAIAALSMGGALALRLAERRPDDVAALALVNPAVNLRRRDLKLVPALSRIVPAIPGIGGDIKDPDVEGEAGYERTPLRALASQLQMWADVRDHLAAVTQPLLVFRSRVDHVVDSSSVEIILRDVSSAERREVILENSYHVATLDYDKRLIFDESAEFFAAQFAHTSDGAGHAAATTEGGQSSSAD